jgi:hypothetical protein
MERQRAVVWRSGRPSAPDRVIDLAAARAGIEQATTTVSPDAVVL